MGNPRHNFDCTVCATFGDQRPAMGHGLCNGHLRQQRLGQALRKLRPMKQSVSVLTCNAPPASGSDACAFDQCRNTAKNGGKGYCPGHYAQLYRGKPLTPLRPKALPPGSSLEDQFEKFVDRTPFGEFGCWHWNGPHAKNGRAMCGFVWNGVKRAWAHQLAFVVANGFLPDGEGTLDHIHGCGKFGCVNPAHLEVRSGIENSANGHVLRSLRDRISRLERHERELEAELNALRARLAAVGQKS